MQKLFEVKAWHDYHGDPLFFLVVDAAGKKCARFASEVEAEKFVAMKEEQNQAELAVNLVALLPTRAWNALYNQLGFAPWATHAQRPKRSCGTKSPASARNP